MLSLCTTKQETIELINTKHPLAHNFKFMRIMIDTFGETCYKDSKLMSGDSLQSIMLNPYVIPKGEEKGDKIEIVQKNM